MTDDDAATQAFGKLARIAEGRAQLYRFLAGSFRDPSADGVRLLQEGTMFGEIGAAIEWLGADRAVFDGALGMLDDLAGQLVDQDPATALRDLKVEYARLFIGPPRPLVHPFGSVHLNQSEGSTKLVGVGRSVRSVESIYADAGVQVVAELREPPDHVSTELEFLYFLCEKEASAWGEGDNEAARQWRSRQRQFVDEHLKEWTGRFFDAVIAQTSHDYYRAVATFGKVFLRMEAGGFRPA